MIAQIRELAQDLPGGADAILDPRVLEAMSAIPREAFVPVGAKDRAYADAPLDIGHDQTISQPFIVALMTSLARPSPTARILEIGTGSGYQAAVLASLAGHVYSIEIVPELAAKAGEVLRAQGLSNVTTRVGDGRLGWADAAPFDAIVVTAAPVELPPALPEQLAPGGRLIIPIGAGRQTLLAFERGAGQLIAKEILAVRFVPLTSRRNLPDPVPKN